MHAQSCEACFRQKPLQLSVWLNTTHTSVRFWRRCPHFERRRPIHALSASVADMKQIRTLAMSSYDLCPTAVLDCRSHLALGLVRQSYSSSSVAYRCLWEVPGWPLAEAPQSQRKEGLRRTCIAVLAQGPVSLGGPSQPCMVLDEDSGLGVHADLEFRLQESSGRSGRLAVAGRRVSLVRFRWRLLRRARHTL